MPKFKRHDFQGETSLYFRCPGCNTSHGVRVQRGKNNSPQAPCWGWNGMLDKATFTPSLLVTYEANPEADPEKYPEWLKKRICHSFIREGKIQFLNDCTHELAGQTVEIPEYK